MNLTAYNKIVIRTCENKCIDKEIFRCMPVNHPATFVKKNVYNDIGGFDTRYQLSADYDFICRAYSNEKKIISINKVLSNMRLGGKTGGTGGVKGLDSAFITAKEDYLIVKRNFNKNKRYAYYRKICILYLRKVKRMFWASKYDF